MAIALIAMKNTLEASINLIPLIYMKYIQIFLLTLVYSLSYLSVVEVNATDELVWDGQTKKEGNYLFFSPYNNQDASYNQNPIYSNNQATIYKLDDTQANINNANIPNNATASIIDPISMIEIFGGCAINEKAILEIEILDATLNEQCVDDFYISNTEISNAQYSEFLLYLSGSTAQPLNNSPAENIGKNNQLLFTLWLSEKQQKAYHIPTAEQWQYAKKAGIQKSKFGFHVAISN